jgi:hypothetical protein
VEVGGKLGKKKKRSKRKESCGDGAAEDEPTASPLVTKPSTERSYVIDRGSLVLDCFR